MRQRVIAGVGQKHGAPGLARNGITRDGNGAPFRGPLLHGPIPPEFQHRLAAVLRAFQNRVGARQEQFVGPQRVRSGCENVVGTQTHLELSTALPDFHP